MFQLQQINLLTSKKSLVLSASPESFRILMATGMSLYVSLRFHLPLYTLPNAPLPSTSPANILCYNGPGKGDIQPQYFLYLIQPTCTK